LPLPVMPWSSHAPKRPKPAATAATARQAADLDSGASEIYRLEAEGHVRIFTPTDQAEGDRAVYDLDQAVLVMTGQNLKLTPPQQVLTARDSMEYWSEKHMAVGRGAATVLTSDGRRFSADVLVAYTKSDDAARPTPASAGGAESGIASSGKLERIEAYGNVEVRTAVDTVRGDRGLYLPDSGIARIFGHVRITHGHNQLNGPLADINLKTGVAQLASSGSQQVEGLIMPKEATTPAPGGASPAPRAGRPLPAAQP
jgi:lipopolysaccharide export system protein LptA